MVVLTEKFRFIRDDVFLCPWVDSKTGKQKLIMQKINLGTKEVEFEDSLRCIHTALTNISPEDFVDYRNDAHVKEYLYNKTLEIRSSEKLKEINLTPKEKYIAFRSWVTGITDSGSEAFRIQTEIENMGNLVYPISNFLLRFMFKVDSEFMEEYILKIERECVYEGMKYESFILMSLIPIFEALYNNYLEQTLEIRKKNKYGDRPKLREFDARILGRIIENSIFNLKEKYLLKFPIYIVYIAHKMETDKNYLPNRIQKLISNKNKLIAFLIPILKLLFKDHQMEGKNQFAEAVIIIESLGLSKKLMAQMYYNVYEIKRSEFISYNLITYDISKVYGLKYLKNLKLLMLGGNNFKGIKIREIKGLDHLTKLTTLHLGGNEITKIEGLEKLRNLRILRLNQNKIKKIEGLDQLKNLEELYLGGNEITKIEGLNQLPKLTTLHLGGNEITKIEGLNQLPPNLRNSLPPYLKHFFYEDCQYVSKKVHFPSIVEHEIGKI